MSVVIYFAFLGGWFLLNLKFSRNGASVFLLGIYLLGAFSSLYLIAFTSLFDGFDITLLPVVYHSLCLFFILGPIVYLANNHKYIKLDRMFLNTLFFIILFFSFFSYLSYIPKLISVINYGSMLDARVAYNHGGLHEESNSISGYLGAIGRPFSIISGYFFFYLLSFERGRKLLIVALAICSFGDVLGSFATAGRGGAVRWAFMMIFYYFLFKQYLPKKLIRYLFFISTPIFSMLTIVFLAITVSRFSGREYPVFVYILNYLGQPFLYFPHQFYDFFNNTFYGMKIFPYLTDESKLRLLSGVETGLNYNITTFSTIVGSFYKDVGFYLTFFIFFCNYVLFLFFCKTSFLSRFTEFKLFYFIITSNVVVNGLFYFQYSSGIYYNAFLLILFISFFLPMTIRYISRTIML